MFLVLFYSKGVLSFLNNFYFKGVLTFFLNNFILKGY